MGVQKLEPIHFWKIQRADKMGRADANQRKQAGTDQINAKRLSCAARPRQKRHGDLSPHGNANKIIGDFWKDSTHLPEYL